MLNNERRRIRDEWFRITKVFLEKVKDTEAHTVMKFLEDKAILVAPQGDALIAEDSASGVWVGTMPIIPGDEKQSPTWASLMNDPFGAMFRPDSTTILLKAHVKYTLPWKAMMLLHEGHHAYTFIATPYDWRNRGIYLSRERDTHAYQNRVFSEYGGNPYKEILDREVLRLEGLSQEHGSAPGSTFFMNKDIATFALDQVFGLAMSESERGTRTAHFMIHSHFELLERHRADYLGGQVAFLDWLYKNANQQ